MIPLTMAEIADVVRGEVHGDPDLLVTGGTYLDSRAPLDGGLFVALVGEHVDGHDYAAGAHAVLGSRPTAAPTVVVPDPVVALGLLAAEVVGQVDPVVVALTGSQGKTGTKDYLAAVLGLLVGVGRVVATAGNNNNEIGVPLTLLRADPDTTHVVVEMGARGVGHVRELCRIASPDVGAVLNVGSAHLGEFGSREAIAQAKGEIVEALSRGGVAVLNADDPLVAAMGVRTQAEVLTFGEAGDVAWRGVALDDLGRPSFELGYGDAWHPVRLLQTGAHQVANAAAAAAMALAVGLPLTDVATALGEAREASPWRMEVHTRDDGLVVVNDSYNANPDSMRAALEALVAIGRARERRTVAVLGEMKELGPEHDSGHLAVGADAARLGVDVVVVVGEVAAGIADGARGAGDRTEVVVTAGRDEALSWVRQNASAGDVVLVKASRGAALEWVADGLLEEPGGATAP